MGSVKYGGGFADGEEPKEDKKGLLDFDVIFKKKQILIYGAILLAGLFSGLAIGDDMKKNKQDIENNHIRHENRLAKVHRAEEERLQQKIEDTTVYFQEQLKITKQSLEDCQNKPIIQDVKPIIN